MARFKKAVRTQARLRLALDGPAGSGKSYSALRFAFSHPDETLKVACIEAGENGGLSLYLGDAPDDRPFDFDILELRNNFAPSEYTTAIEEAGRAGYDILVIDSLSHAWAGSGGALDQVGSKGFTDKDGWKTVTPQHNRMIDSILQSPCHVIVTLRSKMEYLVEEDEKGRKVPKKVGMAPIQRAGMEYEFTIYGSLDYNHTMTVTKSRYRPVQDVMMHRPGAGFMQPVWEWLETGEAATPPELPKTISSEQQKQIEALLLRSGAPQKKFIERLREKYQVDSIDRLSAEQATELEQAMREKLNSRKAETPATAATAVVSSLPATESTVTTNSQPK